MQYHIPIYLVSLSGDQHRREALSQRFPGYYPIMEWVQAIDGRILAAADYFSLAFPSVSNGSRLFSPAEVGCSLSHIKVLERFLDSGCKRCLIIEDDVLGKDTDFDAALTQMSQVGEGAVVIFGGQEGMPSRKYIFGKSSGVDQLYRLPRYSNDYVHRTCCYGVTRQSAQAILDSHRQHLKLADAWGAFFVSGGIEMYFSKLFSHPVDRRDSHIEQSRLVINQSAGKPLSRYIKKRGQRIVRKLGALVCLAKGYRRVIC